MRHSKKKNYTKKRRYRRIQIVMLLLLFILLSILGIMLFQERKTNQTLKDAKEAEALAAQKEADARKKQEEAERARQESEQKKAQEEAAEKLANLNKDVQRAENTATEDSHKTDGLAICMYHFVYDKDDPPKDLNNNFIEVHALEEELQYLVENEYYFPTWEEVRQYVNGDLLLPEKSVVLTFDDGAYSFLDIGVPLFEKYQIPVTSFLIANIDGKEKVEKYASEYMTFQSHSYNMHRGGGNIGHGGIFPVMSHDDAVADLEKSIEIAGNKDAFAYPYGDYNDSCIQAVKDAGFKCAVTTEYGRAKPGDNPLTLPRIRMLKGQSLESFKELVK